MKSKLIIFVLGAIVAYAGPVIASEGHDHDEHKGSMRKEKEEMRENFEPSEDVVNVGNKICPVSGEIIADMGDGKGIQLEHEGKIYNLCCAMCAKDFKKNPDKFIQEINEELESSEHEEHDEHADGHDDDHHDHE